MPNRRQTWPYSSTDPWLNRDAPLGFFQTPDGVLKSTRSLAGPLRTGTEPRVGPRADGRNAAGEGRDSDFGMDRITPRGFDPIGTSDDRIGPMPSSSLVTEQVRRRNDR
jgi:hypothetical protein